MMRNFAKIILVVTCSWTLNSLAAEPDSAALTTEIVRRTQELFDAVALGDRGPWDKYYAADCLFFRYRYNLARTERQSVALTDNAPCEV